jgi:hypothetical protein
LEAVRAQHRLLYDGPLPGGNDDHGSGIDHLLFGEGAAGDDAASLSRDTHDAQ